MVTAATAPHAGVPQPQGGKAAKVDRILADMRQHLLEAMSNQAVKRLHFVYEFCNGGVRKSNVDVDVKYSYVDNAPAV